MLMFINTSRKNAATLQSSRHTPGRLCLDVMRSIGHYERPIHRASLRLCFVDDYPCYVDGIDL